MDPTAGQLGGAGHSRHQAQAREPLGRRLVEADENPAAVDQGCTHPVQPVAHTHTHTHTQLPFVCGESIKTSPQSGAILIKYL